VQANTAVLQRSVGLDSARASVGAIWRRDAIIGPGIVASPFAQARADIYRVETMDEEFESFSRGLGLAGVELSWPFMRVGQGLDVVVEPVVMAAYASNGGDDPRIVNEDSIGFELDDSNLLRPNAASNYDLWEPGGRVSAGIRATVQNHAGQSANVFIGRRWRDEIAPQFTVLNNLEGRASDWVGSVETDLGGHLGAVMRFRLDDESLELRRLDASVRAAVGRFSANARYFQLDDTLAPENPTEEIAGTIAVRLARGWSAQYGLRRDLDSNINLSQDIRAIYQDDCTFLELTYTRRETQAGALGPDEGFRIRVGFTSLGIFGANDGRQQ
jgi:LPS-assembly protein